MQKVFMERLKGKAGLRLVEGVAELAAIGAVTQSPAAYVLPAAERAGPNTAGTYTVDQQVTLNLGVCLIVKKHGDSTGAAASLHLETVKEAVKDELVGWEPPGGTDLVIYGGGRLIDLKDGEVWYLLSFATTTRIRK